MNGVTLIRGLASILEPEVEDWTKLRVLRRCRYRMKATTPITANKNATTPMTAPKIRAVFDDLDSVLPGVVVIETIGALSKEVGQA